MLHLLARMVNDFDTQGESDNLDSSMNLPKMQEILSHSLACVTQARGMAQKLSEECCGALAAVKQDFQLSVPFLDQVRRKHCQESIVNMLRMEHVLQDAVKALHEEQVYNINYII
jgi:hypothetical protein